MNKSATIASLAIFLVILIALPTPSVAFWRACNSTLRAPDRVESPDCSTVTNTCLVHRGEIMRASVFISSTDTHEELMVESFVWIFGIRVRLPSVPPHDNGCNSLFVNNVQQFCPTQPNVQYEWRVEQEVPAITPTFQNSIVQFQLWDRGSLEGCAEITATVI
ncbi:uncharacterized protein [Chironomus tepperi]|uniref:uncharacterized protein n=1 Tax=Chironomus tepperi TaxID=113505 RepID=UPI00391FA979